MVENLIPVDYAAQVIVSLSQQPRLENETFDLLNPRPTTWQWVAGVMRDLGYPFQLVPYQEWRRALMQVATSNPNHPLHGLLMLVPQDQSAAIWIDSWESQPVEARPPISGFAGNAIRCPPVDAVSLERMLADSLRRGLFAVSTPLPHTNAE